MKHSRPHTKKIKDSNWDIRCICGNQEATNDEEAWIQCDSCDVWQHNICMGVSIYTHEMPKVYKCEECDPDAHAEVYSASADSESIWEKRRMAVAKDEERRRLTETILTDRHHSKHEEHERSTNLLPLTAQCHHHTQRKEVEWDLQKYWDQRYQIFSRYDEGIYMTNDLWFGVTPEPVASKIAKDFSVMVPDSKCVLIDLFAGAGGNTIAFALSNRWAKIIAIEKDPSVLACAQRNALIYGVADNITWVNTDCFSYLSVHKLDIDATKTAIFASPPWGGPGYSTSVVFNLHSMQPYSINQIHEATRRMHTALFLPRSSDLNQIATLAPLGKKVEVVQYCMDGASKGLVAYIPAAI